MPRRPKSSTLQPASEASASTLCSEVSWQEIKDHFEGKIIPLKRNMRNMRRRHHEMSRELRALIKVWDEVQAACKPNPQNEKGQP